VLRYTENETFNTVVQCLIEIGVSKLITAVVVFVFVVVLINVLSSIHLFVLMVTF
jgi:hypothetical protein